MSSKFDSSQELSSLAPEKLQDFSVFHEQKKNTKNRNYAVRSSDIDEKSCREKKAKQTDVSVQSKGKWIEHISQSERAFNLI